MVAGAQHATLTGNNLHFSKIQTTTGGLSTPPYIGASIFNFDTNILYIANNISSAADWQPVGGGSGGATSVIDTSSTNYTVLSTSNGNVVRLTSASARSVNLPTGSVNGFSVTLNDEAGTSFTANITVNSAGGDTFPGGGTTYKIFSNYASVTFTYDAGQTEWFVRASYIGFNPGVLSLNSIVGNDLVLQTLDTNEVMINVNSINALSIGATNIDVKKIFFIDDPSDITKQISFAVSSATTGTKSILNFAQTANRILTFPDITDTLVSKTSTDILTNKSVNSLKFNNPGNTFYTNVIGGNNASNLALTLPITAPTAGQVLQSVDTSGTLEWATVLEYSVLETALNPAAALPSSTSTVVLSSGTGPLKYITAGLYGQTLTVINFTGNDITIENNASGSPGLNQQIINPVGTSILNGPNYILPNLYAIEFIMFATSWMIKSIYNAKGLQGNQTGVAPLAGNIGEEIRAVGTADIGSTGVYVDLISIPLTSGVWDITGIFWANMPSSLTAYCAISAYSGNTTTDHVDGDNVSIYVDTFAGVYIYVFTIPSWRVVVNTPTTVPYYLKGKSNLAMVGGNYQRLSAVRVG